MAQKSITEFAGKSMLFEFWKERSFEQTNTSLNVCAQIKLALDGSDDLDEVFTHAEKEHEWLLRAGLALVVKPDQLVKRRGELGLVKLKLTWPQAKEYVRGAALKPLSVSGLEDVQHTFIIEPFVPHEDKHEHYVSFQNTREGTLIYFYHEGGVHVGDVDSKAQKWTCPIDVVSPGKEEIIANLLSELREDARATVAKFIQSLHQYYRSRHFAFLEVNPFVLLDDQITVMDMAAKLDSAAHYTCAKYWGTNFTFPAPFGKKSLPEERYIADLDEKTGASLKLTVLNVTGRIWTMVAGGGASVVYTDTITNYGGGPELANYGEYSGNPNYHLTFEYAQTILQLMTRQQHPDGKLLIVGGGIANFTDVAETFRGIVDAFQQYCKELREHKVKIVVRRGGPNYEQGLRAMKALRTSHGLDIQVFGPETHITAVVPMAMKEMGLGNVPADYKTDAQVELPLLPCLEYRQEAVEQKETENAYNLFTDRTISLVYGIQVKAVQGMLDFDYACGRSKRSVACLVYPFGENHHRKFYWGTSECLIPVYDSMDEACAKHPEVSVVVNFSSFRSAYESTEDSLRFPQIKTIAIIAEGIPEAQTRMLIHKAAESNVRIIGPATVGGIKAGAFKVGNTGGMLDNIISSKLYRPGSVAYVSKSGGMSNELNNIISRNSDGVYEGVAIGGDRYPATTFIDHLLRYEANPAVKFLVLLGEVGGVDEYKVCELLRSGKLRKPLIAWCIGTCSSAFDFEVQFGHAGSNINGDMETSAAKNRELAASGALVPPDFDALGVMVRQVHQRLIANKIIVPFEEPMVPSIPMDYQWAAKLGLVRKPTSFITTISDERGDELKYSGVPISDVLNNNMGIGGTIGLLWFQRTVPPFFARYIEMILVLTADHGPAVSGAHNTIVAARAGKDLISSLVSGLLTIGPRFGGALDEAAEVFSEAFDRNLTPMEFVEEMRAKKQLIPGIGHRVKSVQDPDKRVSILKEYVLEHFPFEAKLLKYALEVEAITTKKKNNLILNVDGCVAVSFVDAIRYSGIFEQGEEDTYLKSGVLNGLFVLGRSVGFMGHYFDQRRLKQPLYRHPWDDIAFVDTPKGPRHKK